MLFSSYINDIMLRIESAIRLFADDCVCYGQIDIIKDRSKLQKGSKLILLRSER